MLSDDKKKQIESLSTDEMLYEINLGTKSRFQREKFAYLQTCYQNRLREIDLDEKYPGGVTWVDPEYDQRFTETPKTIRYLLIIKSFWLRRWTVLLPIIVGVLVALVVHFDSKSTSKPKQEKSETVSKHKTFTEILSEHDKNK